ncbi:hypothetical protein [Halobaculum rubrum]|uniref:hypothetical protein n=1 Tax=Halobaculum rubrum TaxID=2872158 RepID=UPI001CA436AB|nr:hypothetical protein [Halobaculum rubrum]QZX98434.1 hypothetical protein K6T25_09035 [Halobaculum rubrum]
METWLGTADLLRVQGYNTKMAGVGVASRDSSVDDSVGVATLLTDFVEPAAVKKSINDVYCIPVSLDLLSS